MIAPTVLYHATFKAYLPSILANGLGARQPKSWDGSAEGVVCLADDPDMAESFAECADAVSSDIYDSGIVVLKVNANGLALKPDRNIQHDGHIHSWEFDGEVAPSSLEVIK